MKRTAPDRTVNQPKPVERVEVEERHVKLRIIGLIAALVVAIISFGYGINAHTSVDAGWRRIDADGASQENCAQDFVFDYRLGNTSLSAAAENKALVMEYTQLTELAYRLFNHQQTFENEVNPCYINQHPNTVIQVAPALYQVFEMMDRLQSRYIYLAPVYTHYHSLFFCQEDWETAGYDPYQSPDMADYFAQAAAFARDPQAVKVELLGGNYLKLHVSEEYASFAKENGIDRYIDFYWMTDAFIIDFLAQALEAKGYTRGAISSFDGFVRCLSDETESYSFYVYDRIAPGMIGSAARMSYPGGTSLVHLHAFPLNTQKELYYYQFEDGSVRNPYVDIKDGKSKATLPVLIATSAQAGCAETLLKILPLYATDLLDETALLALPQEGIYPLYCRDNTVFTTSPTVTLDQIFDGYSVAKP